MPIKLLSKNKNFIFFSLIFLLISFLIKTEFKLSESFFLIGNEKLKSNLIRTIFFFFVHTCNCWIWHILIKFIKKNKK